MSAMPFTPQELQEIEDRAYNLGWQCGGEDQGSAAWRRLYLSLQDSCILLRYAIENASKVNNKK